MGITPREPEGTLQQMRELHDRVVVITGAAGGIGRALSLEFARHGSLLALIDRDASGLEEIHRTVTALGTRATMHHADVADRRRWLRVKQWRLH